MFNKLSLLVTVLITGKIVQSRTFTCRRLLLKQEEKKKTLSLENQIMSHFIRYANDARPRLGTTRYHHDVEKKGASASNFVVKARKFLKISLIFPLCRNPISNPFET